MLSASKTDLKSNPWNIGDVYAYRFHKHKSKQAHMFGKFILLQKIADEEWCDGIILSRLQLYDKIFDALPKTFDPHDCRILPADSPKRFVDQTQENLFPALDLNVLMVIYKRKDYPLKDLIYVGNFENPYSYPFANPNSSAHNWFDIEDWYCHYRHLWKDFQYEIDEFQNVKITTYKL